MTFADGHEGWPDPDPFETTDVHEAVGTLYPTGYGTRRVTLAQLRAEHHPDKMHPEYARRLFAWLESMGGRVGIGGSWRLTQPTSGCPLCVPEGKSFHQYQDWPSGRYFAAVDLVQAHPTPGAQHIGMTWDVSIPQGSTEARKWGLHANVGGPPSGEPWHMQGIEYDGWQSWVNAGRPDLTYDYPIPGGDWLDMATEAEVRKLVAEEVTKAFVAFTTPNTKGRIPDSVWREQVKFGPNDTPQPAGAELAQQGRRIEKLLAQVDALIGVVTEAAELDEKNHGRTHNKVDRVNARLREAGYALPSAKSLTVESDDNPES